MPSYDENMLYSYTKLLHQIMVVDRSRKFKRRVFAILSVHGVVSKRMTFQGEIQIKPERQQSVINYKKLQYVERQRF